MLVIKTIAALRQYLNHQTEIALVPTMGNLHAGHIQLVKLAKKNSACVVVSIFVNPLQFGANEDLNSYPRTLEADCDQLKDAGADVVFVPNVAEIYPNFNAITADLGQTMTVAPPAIANELCGATRTGHFIGVATVVLKLFNIVQPNIAMFGKKDFQQLFIIQELVKQFNLPINIIAADTMREPDGLAMSSRNGYLTASERAEANRLHKTLELTVENLQKNGLVKITQFEQAATQQLIAAGWQVDYVSIRAVNTLIPAKLDDKHVVVLGAARLGKTRLIDNIELILT